MRNIVWCRVDDRLIHGEVVTAWTPYTHANRIVIVDDEVLLKKITNGNKLDDIYNLLDYLIF